MAIRLVKTAMVASFALLALFAAFNNLLDGGSTKTFVRHVLGMDTTFPDSALRARAIDSAVAVTVAYWLIVVGEAVTGMLLALGGLRLALALRAPAADFNAAKSLAVLGGAAGLLLWFTGFMVVGGEWFAMWQSKEWNAVPSAFNLVVVLLLVLIFLIQRDEEAA